MLSKYLSLEKYLNQLTYDSNDIVNGINSGYEDQPLCIAQHLIGELKGDNVSPIDEALSYQRLIQQGKSIKEISSQIEKSQSYIRSRIRLLQLPESIYFLVNTGLLNESKSKRLLELNAILKNTKWTPRRQYSSMGTDVDSWAKVFQILIAWQYYWLSNSEFAKVIDKLRYTILQLTWSIINGNKLAVKNITISQLRRIMGIKVRNLTDGEILWIFQYTKDKEEK